MTVVVERRPAIDRHVPTDVSSWGGAVACVVVAAACGTEGAPALEGSADDVISWRDVAPLYQRHCVACHHEGGIGPMSLTTHEEAERWASASLAAMEARTMPPWGATADGSCGEFRDPRWLDSAVIDTMAAWVAADRPAGPPPSLEPLEPPEPVGLPDARSLQGPSYVPEIVGGPLAEFDEYRCFALDPGLDVDQFITGYAVQPSNPALVHHLLAMPVDPEGEANGSGATNREVIEAADAESPDRAGWPCLDGESAEFSGSGVPVAWAPGQGVVNYPEGTGLRLTADDLVVVQIHYNLVDPATRGQSDQTTLQLRLQDTVAREGFFDLPDALLETLGEPEPTTLEPGRESVEFSWELSMATYAGPSSTVDLYGVFPHMHEYGVSLHASIERADGQRRCAVEVPRWDFDWQLFYFYERPISLAEGDTLHVTCRYDTRGATEPVLPGWGTRNEMCLLGVFVVP